MSSSQNGRYVIYALKGWIQAGMDRYLYRESYSYQQIMREASRTIGSTLDLHTLLQYVCHIAVRTCRPDLVAIFIKTASDGSFYLSGHEESGYAAEGSRPPPGSADKALYVS